MCSSFILIRKFTSKTFLAEQMFLHLATENYRSFFTWTCHFLGEESNQLTLVLGEKTEKKEFKLKKVKVQIT